MRTARGVGREAVENGHGREPRLDAPLPPAPDLDADPPLHPFTKCIRLIGWLSVLFLFAEQTTIEESWELIILLPLSYLIECWDWWIERRCSRDASESEASKSADERLFHGLRFREGTHGEENAA